MCDSATVAGVAEAVARGAWIGGVEAERGGAHMLWGRLRDGSWMGENTDDWIGVIRVVLVRKSLYLAKGYSSGVLILISL